MKIQRLKMKVAPIFLIYEEMDVCYSTTQIDINRNLSVNMGIKFQK